MKKFLPLIFVTLLLAGCGNTEQSELIQGPQSIDSNTDQTEKLEPSVDIYFNNRFLVPQVDEGIYSSDVRFQILTGGFSKNQTKVFFRGVELFGIDAPTFQVIDSMYAKDKNYIIKIDLDSLSIISDDPNHFFEDQSHQSTKRVKLTGINQSIEIPQGWNIVSEDTNNALDSFSIITDSYVYIISGTQKLKIPTKLHLSIDNLSDSGKYVYSLSSEEEKKVKLGDIVETTYEGTANMGYGIKIAGKLYMISVGASAEIPELEGNMEVVYAYSRPANYWNLVHDKIKQSISSLKK